MKLNNIINLSILVLANLLITDMATGQENLSQQVSLTWRPTKEYNSKDNLSLQLIVKNNSNQELSLADWQLWFNAMYPIEEKQTTDFTLHDENGSLFRVDFHKSKIAAKDSLVLEYVSKYAISGVSTIPNGFYFQQKSNHCVYFPINNVYAENYKVPAADNKDFYEKLYAKNNRLTVSSATEGIFPTPYKVIDVKRGYFNVNDIRLFIGKELAETNAVFDQFLSPYFSKVAHTSNIKKSNLAIVYNKAIPSESYHLAINAKGILIESSSNSGVFYAIQSLKSLIPAGELKISKLPYLRVEDKPRFPYRGFMLDIARNFRDKEVIKKYIDLMSMYKLNVFHFHFSDDEGWRIEMPSIPELTTIGANRSPLFKDGNSIQPAFGSGGYATKGQYLSKADFIEVLKYAKDRFIQVVPEIETPGHARAAIKSMEQRYFNLMKEGRAEEAAKYLLYDFKDESEYRTVQHWSDNVINPALPSVYTFLGQVIDDFSAMYKEAGLTLEKVSIGGDEVPPGVWEKSPQIAKLMKDQQMSSVHEVWSYYIQKVQELCATKGISIAGWEEIGMANKGNGMVENPNMPNKGNMQLDVWNNVIGFGQEDLAYRLANTGYKTVLISASNTYFDMMWANTFTEPGLKWATYADLYHAYSLFPEDYFTNLHTYYSAYKLSADDLKKKVRLNATGRANFLGIKGGVFAETLTSDSSLDYLVFPRFYVLAERAWAPKKIYEEESKYDQKSFDKDYNSFVNRISNNELPKLSGKIKFRLPGVGVQISDGKIYANTEYHGFKVYYTLDGTKPTKDSYLYTGPIKMPQAAKIIFAVIDADERIGPATEIML